MKTAPKTLNPNRIPSRDYAMVALINGATKSGAHKDRKKAQNKKAARQPVRCEEW